MKIEEPLVVQSPFMDQELDLPEPVETFEPPEIESAAGIQARDLSSPIIELRDVWLRFGTKEVLRGRGIVAGSA